MHVNGNVFATISTEFPSWITDQMTLKNKDEAQVSVCQFLRESCKPFERGHHLSAKNVIYYLVISNPEAEAEVILFFVQNALGNLVTLTMKQRHAVVTI